MKETMHGITILLTAIAYIATLLSIILTFDPGNREDNLYGKVAITLILISAYLTLISIVLS